jgi:hypothetical protein
LRQLEAQTWLGDDLFDLTERVQHAKLALIDHKQGRCEHRNAYEK